MHESSLIADLLRRIDSVARVENARRVIAVSVRLGALSHVSPEHFAGHFERASAGTIADGARLTITVSGDADDADAQAILLKNIELEI